MNTETPLTNPIEKEAAAPVDLSRHTVPIFVDAHMLIEVLKLLGDVLAGKAGLVVTVPPEIKDLKVISQVHRFDEIDEGLEERRFSYLEAFLDAPVSWNGVLATASIQSPADETPGA